MNKLVFVLLLLFPVSCFSQVWNNADLEKAIIDAAATGKAVELPAKVVLDKTVNLGLRQSVRFQGGGGSLINYNQATLPRVGGSRIHWVGPKDQPIFLTSGVGNQWAGITFVLDKPTEACVKVTKGSGLGTGKMLIDSCSFLENPETRQQSIGLLMGESITDGNCDESTIRDCTSIDMKSLFESRNNQSVGHRFYNNFSNRNAVTFNFEAGGKVAVFGHSCVNDLTFMRLGKQGSGNNHFAVYGLSVDSKVPENWKLIDNSASRSSFVTIEGFLSSKSSGPRSQLIINDKPGFDLTKLVGITATVQR